MPYADDRPPAPDNRLLTPGEAAVLCRVKPKTVTRWGNAGRLTLVRTLGGHSRFLEREVRALPECRGDQVAADPPGHSIPAPRSAAHDQVPAGAAPATSAATSAKSSAASTRRQA